MCPPSRQLRLRLAFGLATILCAGVLGAGVGCAEQDYTLWICLNPVTGKEDGTIGDESHFVNGVFDPCHCYDPCGPQKTCPIVVDAGPPPPGCDADAGDGGG
jgi:hypothetical protein